MKLTKKQKENIFLLFNSVLILVAISILYLYLSKNFETYNRSKYLKKDTTVTNIKKVDTVKRYIEEVSFTELEEKQLRKIFRDYYSIIMDAESKYNIPHTWIVSIIMVESGGNPKAKSRFGAKGLMQIMPHTAKELGIKNVYDPYENIMGGTKYLATLVKKFDSLELIFGSYNTGPNRTKEEIKRKAGTYPEKVIKYSKYIH